MVRTQLYLGFILLLCVNITFLFLHSQNAKRRWLEDELDATRKLVSHLALTDLALWTEARYTRHPALADFFAPFQDSPASFEHFPAGSVIAPSHPAVTTTIRVRKKTAGSDQ
jgi:hypothetical protein